MKPPDQVFVTPNGRFEVGKKICLSFTSYHPESWGNWNVEAMLVGLVTFMLTDEPTTGGISCSSWKRQAFAKESQAFNLKNPIFVKFFREHVENLKIEVEKADYNEKEAVVLNQKDNIVSIKMYVWLSILFVFLWFIYQKVTSK